MAEEKLNRGLKNRHLQMIALGTAVGTGLFYGSTETISLAGPSVALSYFIGGVVIFLIMRMLGEMAVEEPVAGSFSHYADKYWNEFTGFLAGWNYWFVYIITGMLELSVVGIYMNFWFPDLPHWATALAVLTLITLINLITVRAYGEVEFWMAFVKIAAIILMIVFGAWLIFADPRPFPENFSNLWEHGGFFPNGAQSFMLSLAPVLLSFGGIEMIGLTAGEVENPEKNLPTAIHRVIYRILIFYVGSMFVLMTIWPWFNVGKEASPFVQIFEKLGIRAAADILNFVVLSAAISVYNSALYSNSRMLYGLAQSGNAPNFFTKLSAGKVPINGIFFSSGITLTTVALTYLFPGKVFIYLMAAVTGAFITSWVLIALTHLKFKKFCIEQGIKTKFPSLFYPVANYFCLAFFALILCMMATMEGMRIALVVTPVWIFVVWLAFKKYRKKA